MLSKRSIAMLQACEHATLGKPMLGISFARASHLRDKGLLGYRAFHPELGHGGHFITEAGRAALEQGE